MTKSKPTWPKGAWTPRRRGNIYCSPACGADCTWKAFQAALRKAKALAKRLGPGWKPVVFENCAWHWHAELRTGKRKLKVYPSEGIGKTTFWTLYGEHGGETQWTDPNNKHYADPRQAVNAQNRRVQEYAQAMAEDAANLQSAVIAARRR